MPDVEARLYAELYGKALCHVHVGEDGNVDIVEFRGYFSRVAFIDFNDTFASLHGVERASRQAENGCQPVFKLCAQGKSYAIVGAITIRDIGYI